MMLWLEYVHAAEMDTENALEHLCDAVIDTIAMGGLLDMRCLDAKRINPACLELVLRLTQHAPAHVLHKDLAIALLAS